MFGALDERLSPEPLSTVSYGQGYGCIPWLRMHHYSRHVGMRAPTPLRTLEATLRTHISKRADVVGAHWSSHRADEKCSWQGTARNGKLMCCRRCRHVQVTICQPRTTLVNAKP